MQEIEKDKAPCYFNLLQFKDNFTLSTWGWEAKGAPASGPNPVRIFKTPGGRPTSRQISASSKQVLKLEIVQHEKLM